MTKDQIRISMPGFAIIMNSEQEYGLVIDREFRTGLMPVGGALHADADGILRLMNEFGVKADAFDHGGAAALRFVAPTSKVRKIQNWFIQRTERDLDLGRVIRTSLFQETGTLTRHEASTATGKLRGYSQMEGVTFRTGVKERDTLYLVEDYAVFFPREVLAKLVQCSQAQRSYFRFVPAADILDGKTLINDQWVPINPISKTLLNPQMPPKNGRKRS
jgi:hypothetical protein